MDGSFCPSIAYALASVPAAELTVFSKLPTACRSYRETLNKRDNVEDPVEKDRLLKDCHKRCALRTLKVLETNGGIFIKLGQHLVCAQPAKTLTNVSEC